jgi:hypothetical protein
LSMQDCSIDGPAKHVIRAKWCSSCLEHAHQIINLIQCCHGINLVLKKHQIQIVESITWAMIPHFLSLTHGIFVSDMGFMSFCYTRGPGMEVSHLNMILTHIGMWKIIPIPRYIQMFIKL